MTIKEEIAKITAELPSGVKLIAVSKFHPAEAVMEAYEAGQRLFGENKVQEMVAKQEVLPKDLEWHFIGHLQTNKVKYIAPFVAMIHSIDSLHLLTEVNRQAEKVGRVINVLLQIHIAHEETKFGMTFDECRALLNEGTWKQLNHVQICGLMGMATFTDNMEQVDGEFAGLQAFFEELKGNWFADDTAFKELSMGMTDDYPIAIRHGSTFVRIGTLIFGERNYNK
ncbi:MAG: YggS family pyridoxal phosphate-dependent enzyme [Bacteroidaceae bacterium]|nr:YggS family pyridoxal phosphate-dependent enzyme [Bacteroidaceae bacterium]